MPPDPTITGVGVISSIGQGKDAFTDALLAGKSSFGYLSRVGRAQAREYIGAEIGHVDYPSQFTKQTLRAASLSARLALVVLREAWEDARLSEVDPARIGLIVGGSNVQQRDVFLTQESYRTRTEFLPPTYALSFMDTDLCGFCTAQFGIRGLAFTVGGASASGQLAIIQAAQAVVTGQVEVCVALGAMMDLSHWECRGFRSIGAMGSDRHANAPSAACRPFDRDHDGFIFGESSGAVVVESAESAQRRRCNPYAILRGHGLSIDGNRNPDPSVAGETLAIRRALHGAAWSAKEIDYVNPHGTGSIVGDDAELKALHACGLTHGYINATKSIIGHGLTAAGTVEVIATLLQMRSGKLHPTRNLDNPVDPTLNWIVGAGAGHQIQRALTLSMGFGGINTAMCWGRP